MAARYARRVDRESGGGESSPAAAVGADVTVDASLHPPGSTLTVRYRSDWNVAQLQNPPLTETKTVQVQSRSVVHVDLPPAGMMILS